MSHHTYAHRTVFGTYNGYCSCSGLLFFGDRDWVRARLREHEASFSTPKFTGFDGIPDWTEKDTRIQQLERGLKAAVETLEYGVNKNTEQAKQIEDLKDAYARMQSSAADDLLKAKLSYQKLRTEVWRAATDIRRVKADPTLRFSTEDVLNVLEERLRGWL